MMQEKVKLIPDAGEGSTDNCPNDLCLLEELFSSLLCPEEAMITAYDTKSEVS